MAQYVFTGRVIHDKDEFLKGQLCPEHLLSQMKAKKLVEVLPEPKPVEPPKAKAKKAD